MTANRIRTSLSSAPSAVTEEEKAQRMARLERELWFQHGAVVIRMSDPGMAIVVEAVGQTKFGKRHSSENSR